MHRLQPSSPRTFALRDGLLACAFCAAAIAATWDAWSDGYRIAMTDEECSYVLLAPFVIAWIAWVRRGQLKSCPVRGAWLGVLAIAAGWMLYWHGYLHDPVIWRAGAVAIALAAIIAAAGVNVLLRFLPAFAAFAFLIPIDLTGRYRLAGPLQSATAISAQWVCDLLGIYVQRAGNLLTINGVDISVAEACNGMRMILTLFLVCYVVAFTLPLRGWVRAVVLLLSPVVAIASNVARLVPTVWVFGHSSAAAAERFHDVSGWVMTLLAFLLLIAVLRLLQRFTGSMVNEPNLAST